MGGKKPPELQVSVPDNGQATLKIGRGGSRAGAGRKKVEGKTTKPVRLLLDDEKWSMVEKIVQHSKRPMSEVLAEIVEHGLEVKLLEFMRNDGTYEWEEESETNGICT